MELLEVQDLDDEDAVAHAIISKWESNRDFSLINNPARFLSTIKKAKLPYYDSLMKDVFDTKHIVSFIKKLERSYPGTGINVMIALMRAGFERREYEGIFKDSVKSMLEKGYFKSLITALTDIRTVNKDWGRVISKDLIIKALLETYKKDIESSMGDMLNVKSAIDQFRKAGYNYPEFKVIEKSIKES